LLGRLKKREAPPSDQEDPSPDSLEDPETGLPGAARFEEVLERQISRDLRYGSTSALALFEIGLAERADEPQPSPAPFVATILRAAVRGSDVVARVSPAMFAVLLVEATAEGATQFTERVRTKIGSSPYARRADGSGLYARAWAGVAPWESRYATVEEYARASERALAATFRGYEAAQEWYRGEGVSRPSIA
jgi:GGDEF domain-containing protein